MSDYDIRTTSLLKMPSFSRGFARSIDLFGRLDKYSYKANAVQADKLALTRDWRQVGRALFNALKHYGSKEKKA